MSLVAESKSGSLSGQASIDVFIVALVDRLEKEPTRSLTGTKPGIVKKVLDGTPGLDGVYNHEVMARQLCLAINAEHRKPLGLSVESLGGGLVKVMLS